LASVVELDLDERERQNFAGSVAAVRADIQRLVAL
jgi:hypothetical protein